MSEKNPVRIHQFDTDGTYYIQALRWQTVTLADSADEITETLIEHAKNYRPIGTAHARIITVEMLEKLIDLVGPCFSRTSDMYEKASAGGFGEACQMLRMFLRGQLDMTDKGLVQATIKGRGSDYRWMKEKGEVDER